MIIDNIKIGNTKCILFVGENQYDFASITAVSYKIKKGMEIPNEKFWEMLNESDKILCKEYLFGLIAKYQKTEQGYRDKLYSKNFHKNAVENAIDIAKSYGYIDDDVYCRNYIATYQDKKGKLRLKNELYNKGISSSIYEKYLELTNDNQIALASKFADKWCQRNKLDFDSKDKLVRHLVGKGFSFDVINTVISEIKNNN
ncbi:MAG: regulatory protein RecX [Clostridia bacterium]